MASLAARSLAEQFSQKGVSKGCWFYTQMSMFAQLTTHMHCHSYPRPQTEAF